MPLSSLSHPAPPLESLGTDDLRNLVLLYLSVAYEADRNFDPAEHQMVLSLIRQWVPNMRPAEAEGVVDTAFSALRGGMTDDLETLARALGAVLTPKLRRRVLTDLGQIARADGFLSVEEASMIRRVRAVLGAQEEGKRGRGDC